MLAAHTYRDRTEAGRVLAQHLAHYREEPGVLVLALPRGGVPVGREVARFLGAPLDVFLVRKLGLPGHEEFAIGAIASGGVRLLNDEIVAEAGLSPSQIEEIAQREAARLARRETLCRSSRPPEPIAGRTAIVVDDGVATGFSVRAAMTAIRRQRPERLVIAVPVGPPETCDELATEADEVVCPLRPARFQAVGLWYAHFDATTDTEVETALGEAAKIPRRPKSEARRPLAREKH